MKSLANKFKKHQSPPPSTAASSAPAPTTPARRSNQNEPVSRIAWPPQGVTIETVGELIDSTVLCPSSQNYPLTISQQHEATNAQETSVDPSPSASTCSTLSATLSTLTRTTPFAACPTIPSLTSLTLTNLATRRTCPTKPKCPASSRKLQQSVTLMRTTRARIGEK